MQMSLQVQLLRDAGVNGLEVLELLVCLRLQLHGVTMLQLQLRRHHSVMVCASPRLQRCSPILRNDRNLFKSCTTQTWCKSTSPKSDDFRAACHRVLLSTPPFSGTDQQEIALPQRETVPLLSRSATQTLQHSMKQHSQHRHQLENAALPQQETLACY